MSQQVVLTVSGAPDILRLTAANDPVGLGLISIFGRGSSSIPPATSAALRNASWA
jgi:hypothetical protein